MLWNNVELTITSIGNKLSHRKNNIADLEDVRVAGCFCVFQVLCYNVDIFRM